MRADGGARLHAVREVLSLQHLLQGRLRHQAQDVGRGHRSEPLRVVSHLNQLPVEHEAQLLEVRFSVRRDLRLRQHGPRFGATAGVTDQSGVVADDQHDRVAVVLKVPQHIKDDEMADVQVGSGRIESQLHAEPVAALEPCAQVIFDVDLHRPLAQSLEELPTHGFGLVIDHPWTEKDLRIWRQKRLEQREHRPVDRVDEIDHEQGVVHRLAQVLLQAIELGPADWIGSRPQLVDKNHREQDCGQETKQRAQRSVQHDGRDLDLRVRQLGRHLDDQQHGDDDAEEAVDPRVRHLEARGLLEDAARLDAHAARRPDGDEQGDQADEPADQAAEESTHAIRDDEHDRKDVDPGHLTLPPVRHAIACEMRAGSHSLNLARCLFSSPSLISDITLSTSASVRVRSGLRKVKVNAMLL